MGAGDLKTVTIRDESWDKEEHVVIRELTFAEETEFNLAMMGDLTIAQSQDKDVQSTMKLNEFDVATRSLEKTLKSIESWTLTKGGKVLPLTLASLKLIKGAYGDFIADKIKELNPERDDDFQGEGGDKRPDGQEQAAKGNDTG
jgi:hypothetical protein